MVVFNLPVLFLMIYFLSQPMLYSLKFDSQLSRPRIFEVSVHIIGRILALGKDRQTLRSRTIDKVVELKT